MKSYISSLLLVLSLVGLTSAYALTAIDNSDDGILSGASWMAVVKTKTDAGIKIVAPDKKILMYFDARPSDEFSLNYGAEDHISVFRFGGDSDE